MSASPRFGAESRSSRLFSPERPGGSGTGSDPEPTFEESLARLGEIVEALERGDAPLEKGLALFEEGVALSKRCHALLATAEDRISRLVQGPGGEARLDLFGAEPGEETG